jgi:hypothetical protein
MKEERVCVSVLQMQDSTGHYCYRRDFLWELAHVVMESNKSHHLLSAI